VAIIILLTAASAQVKHTGQLII